MFCTWQIVGSTSGMIECDNGCWYVQELELGAVEFPCEINVIRICFYFTWYLHQLISCSTVTVHLAGSANWRNWKFPSQLVILDISKTYSQLTLYVQCHWIAFSVSLTVTSHTSVQTTTSPTNVLKHKTLVSHHNAFSNIVVQNLPLQGWIFSVFSYILLVVFLW